MKKIFLFITFLTMCINTSKAQKEIILEDIWASNTFDARSIPGFNFMKDGRQYTLQERNEIVAYDITTGEKTQTIFDPDRKSTRLNSSHVAISYAVFCLKK